MLSHRCKHQRKQKATMSTHFALIRASPTRREDMPVCSHVVIYLWIPEYKATTSARKRRKVRNIARGKNDDTQRDYGRCFRNPSIHLQNSIFFARSSRRQDVPSVPPHRLKTRVRQRRSNDKGVTTMLLRHTNCPLKTATTLDPVCIRVSTLCC